MMKMRSEQTGRSMVEMLGVLAIIGVLSVGGIAGYSKAMAKYKLTKAMDQVSTTVTNIRTLYSGQPNYSGLTKKVAVQMGAVGAEMLNGVKPESFTSSNKVLNAFAGEVNIEATTVNSVASAGFKVTFKGLGREACVALMSADWGSGSGSGLVSVGSEGSAKGTVAAGTLPVSLATASGACNAAGDTNTVEWIYY